ncbi:MAG: hypothetical protein D6690_08285 [Nitrospirae bacterium]|nr:MAG: hypothetical protein D6690_08285 [Nitrospirota bacterium]
MNGIPIQIAPRSRMCGSKGSTLVEAVIATALLAIVLLGFAGVATVGVRGAAVGQKMTTAIALARDKMEEIRLKGYRPQLAASDTVIEPYGTIPYAPYHARRTVIHPHQPIVGLQTITVTVSWDHDGHDIEFATIVAE